MIKNALFLAVFLLSGCAAKKPVELPPAGLVCMCNNLSENSAYKKSLVCVNAIKDAQQLKNSYPCLVNE